MTSPMINYITLDLDSPVVHVLRFSTAIINDWLARPDVKDGVFFQTALFKALDRACVDLQYPGYRHYILIEVTR